MGFESSLWTNAETKAQKYKDLVLQKSNIYANVKFINLSMSALGILDRCTSDFLDMLTDLQFDDATKNYILRKITTIATCWILRHVQRSSAISRIYSEFKIRVVYSHEFIATSM